MERTIVIFPGHHVTCPGARSEATGLCEQHICSTVVERAAAKMRESNVPVIAPPLDLAPLSGNGNQKRLRQRKNISLNDRIVWLQAYPDPVEAVIEVHANWSSWPSTNYALAVVADDPISEQWGGALAAQFVNIDPSETRHHVWTERQLGRDLRVIGEVSKRVILCEGFFISSDWFVEQASTTEGLDALLWSYAGAIAAGVQTALERVPRSHA